MKASDSGQPEQMQQLMNTEEGRSLQLFTQETNNTPIQAASEEMIHKLNQVYL